MEEIYLALDSLAPAPMRPGARCGILQRVARAAPGVGIATLVIGGGWSSRSYHFAARESDRLPPLLIERLQSRGAAQQKQYRPRRLPLC